MKTLLKIIPAILLLPLLSRAQSNYKPGYVVNLKGDTLRGSVDYQEWDKNPTQVSFKNGSGNAQELSLKNTKAFGVTGFEHFERGIVSVSLDEIEATKATARIDSNYHIDTVFLRVISGGSTLTLYSYKDDIKVRFYLVETGQSPPQELEFHAYSGDNQAIQYVNRYRTQLQYIAQKDAVGNTGLARTISQARYDEGDLLKIVSTINGNAGSTFTAKSLVGIRFFAGLSAVSNDMLFNGDITYPDNYHISPRASVGVDFLANKITQRLFLRIEVSVSTDTHDFTNSYQKSE